MVYALLNIYIYIYIHIYIYSDRVNGGHVVFCAFLLF
jgi:hypothetical protein